MHARAPRNNCCNIRRLFRHSAFSMALKTAKCLWLTPLFQSVPVINIYIYIYNWCTLKNIIYVLAIGHIDGQFRRMSVASRRTRVGRGSGARACVCTTHT